MTSNEPFIALDESEAVDAAQWRGYLVRVVRRDSHYYPVEPEHNPFRVNFEIDAGIVTQAYYG